MLRAIFGEKASDVRDTSLRLPPGASGTVVEVRIFSRRGLEKDERARAIERQDIERLAKDRDDEQVIIERAYTNRLREILNGQKLSSDFKDFKKGYRNKKTKFYRIINEIPTILMILIILLIIVKPDINI